MVYTPGTLVVATGEAPYAVVGLDRYTGRERWRFRPGGTESAAAGLVADDRVVNVWWSSPTSDTIYSVGLKDGKELTDWMVARRKSATGESRAGGPGFFYAYQPSAVGTGGRARAWNNQTGDPLWRKSLNVAEAPRVRGNRVFMWDQAKRKTSIISKDARTGKESWRYERSGIDSHEEQYSGADLLIRMRGTQDMVAVINSLTGVIVGVGPLDGDVAQKGHLSMSENNLFASYGPTVTRLEAKKGEELTFQFSELVEGGQFDAVKELHRVLKPFVDELPAARNIHQRVLSRNYQDTADRLKSGSFPALIALMQRMSKDEAMNFYEDFRGYIVNVDELLKPHAAVKKVTGKEVTDIGAIVRRIVSLVIRFERKLGSEGDKKTIGALRDVGIRLSELLLASGGFEDAHFMLHEMFSRGWMDRSTKLTSLTRRATAELVSSKLGKFAKAIQAQEDMDAVMLEILEIPSVALVVPKPPALDSIPDMTREDYVTFLGQLRVAVRAE